MSEEIRGQDIQARRLSARPEGFAGSLRTLGLGVQPNYWPELHGLRIPTLLITGARDEKFTGDRPEDGRRVAHGLAQDVRRTWGTPPHLECAMDYADEVLTFLKTPWMETPLVEREATGSM